MVGASGQYFNCQDRPSAHMSINQSHLPVGATVAPIILSLDKTKLSNFHGDKSAWPLYLTIGNLSKEVQRMPSAHLTILIRYLPMDNFKCFSEKKRKVMHYQTFHSCMSFITLLAATEFPWHVQTTRYAMFGQWWRRMLQTIWNSAWWPVIWRTAAQ